ncbi:hypothetical protein RRG08_046267 [Elysia crispata]|uniref:Uncharacterized protein n=1 Tax=Elysia crispata TaxID=231223 RepID=A0AAE0YM66_9GAST|nr:hypothetical protein RRG08_046267 [Elysia crispata]
MPHHEIFPGPSEIPGRVYHCRASNGTGEPPLAPRRPRTTEIKHSHGALTSANEPNRIGFDSGANDGLTELCDMVNIVCKYGHYLNSFWDNVEDFEGEPFRLIN